jgi:hypothetical protein
MAGGAGYAMGADGTAFPVPGGAADPRVVAQKEAADSTILGIGATLDQTIRFKAVNQTGDGNGLDLDKLSQLDLRQSGFVFQPSENDPLRPRHAMLAGKPVRSCAHEPGHVIDQDQGIGLERV